VNLNYLGYNVVSMVVLASRILLCIPVSRLLVSGLVCVAIFD
jgi:hypothetical protein